MAKKVIDQLRSLEIGEKKQIKAMKNTLIKARQKLKSEGLEYSFKVVKEAEVIIEVVRK